MKTAPLILSELMASNKLLFELIHNGLILSLFGEILLKLPLYLDEKDSQETQNSSIHK